MFILRVLLVVCNMSITDLKNQCRHPIKIVPILVGALSAANEAMYGEMLAKYVDDPSNFFSVSSDFCHWGARCASILSISVQTAF